MCQKYQFKDFINTIMKLNIISAKKPASKEVRVKTYLNSQRVKPAAKTQNSSRCKTDLIKKYIAKSIITSDAIYLCFVL